MVEGIVRCENGMEVGRCQNCESKTRLAATATLLSHSRSTFLATDSLIPIETSVAVHTHRRVEKRKHKWRVHSLCVWNGQTNSVRVRLDDWELLEPLVAAVVVELLLLPRLFAREDIGGGVHVPEGCSESTVLVWRHLELLWLWLELLLLLLLREVGGNGRGREDREDVVLKEGGDGAREAEVGDVADVGAVEERSDEADGRTEGGVDKVEGEVERDEERDEELVGDDGVWGPVERDVEHVDDKEGDDGPPRPAERKEAAGGRGDSDDERDDSAVVEEHADDEQEGRLLAAHDALDDREVVERGEHERHEPERRRSERHVHERQQLLRVRVRVRHVERVRARAREDPHERRDEHERRKHAHHRCVH